MLTTTTKPQFRPIAPEQYVDISERVCQMRYETSEVPAIAGAKLSGRQVGPVSLAYYESRGLEHGTRTIEHIRSNPFDYFILCVPLQARFQFVHAGLESEVVQGSAVLLSAQRPFDAYISGLPDADWHSSLQVRIPGALLRSRAPLVDQLCNRSFSVTSGGGAMLRTLLLASLQETGPLQTVQAQHYGRALAELIAGCMQEIDRGPRPTRETPSSTETVFDRALSFIECQLSATNLDTELVAKHCHVSPRYLHKIFAQRSLTVAGHIREMRLQCCRTAFQDSRMANRSIFEIACRWGFSDPSHFGRLYRKRFGISPSRERTRDPD